MILLSLLLPAVMVAFLFATDALENLLFPCPEVPDALTPASDGDEHLTL
ncbi:hypothetical protein [Streptomyces sp. NPDC001744]